MTGVALPIGLFASSFFMVVAILAGIVTVYSGLKVRKNLKGPDSRGQITP